jgi:hypothetical protein
VIKCGLPEDIVPQGSPKRPTMSMFQIRMRFWCPTVGEAEHLPHWLLQSRVLRE